MNVTSIKTRKSLEEWALLIKEQKQSGLSARRWCEDKNINPRQFYRWHQKLFNSLGLSDTQNQQGSTKQNTLAGRQTSDESIVFAEVGVQATSINQRPDRRSAICVQCAKCNVIVESGMDDATIKSVFSALGVTC